MANLEASYEYCRVLHREYGRTYYLATRLLPRWKRRHVHALYGFTRYADELVDALDGTPAAVRAARLAAFGDRFAAALAGAPTADPALPALVHTVRLLGLAFQLTNFIRDVGEDADRGRIYLPRKDLAEFGVTPDELRTKVATPAVRRLIAFEVDRAREHYRRAAPGIPLLDRRSQPCIRTAYDLYGGILDEIVLAGYDVFTRRATVPTSKRLAVAVTRYLGVVR